MFSDVHSKEVLMDALAEVEREIEQLHEKLQRATHRRLELLKRKLIACVHCKKGSRIGSWTFIQETWTTPTYGCNGGGNEVYEGTETCSIRCPKCDQENYLFTHPGKKKILPLLKEGLDLFGEYEVRHSGSIS